MHNICSHVLLQPKQNTSTSIFAHTSNKSWHASFVIQAMMCGVHLWVGYQGACEANGPWPQCTVSVKCGTVWAVQPHVLSSWGISLLVQQVAGYNHNCIHCSDSADKASIYLGLARGEFVLSNLTHIYAHNRIVLAGLKYCIHMLYVMQNEEGESKVVIV